ncbi:MAG: hypothetical protein WCR52_00605 [Bacteroidota bacterium]
MQKHALKDFEFHINPATWNTAQDLVQAGAVKNLREVERHFWVALVETEEGAFETEIIITPQKIKAFTCECFTEGRRLMCPHVAASLFKVRQFLEQQSEARKEKAAKKEASALSRLTVQTALEHATPEALDAFVRDYARKDRDFALALKTWFAADVTISENPFALILGSLIPKHSKPQTMREPEFRRIRRTLDDLEIQRSNAETQGNHRIVFQISTALLKYLLPLLPKMEEHKQELFLPYCRQALQSLMALNTAIVSPELREDAWQMVYTLGVKGLYFNELLRDALRFVGPMFSDAQKFDQISEYFDQTPYPAPPFVLQLFLIALIQHKMPAAALIRVLDDYHSLPALIREAILQLYYLKYWDATSALIEYFVKNQVFSGTQRRELEDILFFIAEQTGDHTRRNRILQERFIQTGQFDFFNKLKGATDNKWPTYLAQILGALKQKNDTKTIAAVFAAEGKREELANLLGMMDELPILQRYEDLFLETDKGFIRERYTTILSDYLREHFGRPASAYVRDRLVGLVAKGAIGLAKEIIAELTERFEERHTLSEELLELFPKNKRKDAFYL